MGFLLIATHATAAAIIRTAAAPFWGRALDRVGAKPVLIFCSFGVTVIPLFWLFTGPENLWPLVLDALLGGFLWAGHGQAIFYLPLAVAPRQGRAFYLGAFSAVGGLALGVVSALAGGLLTVMPPTLHVGSYVFPSLYVLFLLTSLARAGAATLAIKIVEPGSGEVSELFAGKPPPSVPPTRAATR
jgi:MFS family permease